MWSNVNPSFVTHFLDFTILRTKNHDSQTLKPPQMQKKIMPFLKIKYFETFGSFPSQFPIKMFESYKNVRINGNLPMVLNKMTDDFGHLSKSF